MKFLRALPLLVVMLVCCAAPVLAGDCVKCGWSSKGFYCLMGQGQGGTFCFVDPPWGCYIYGSCGFPIDPGAAPKPDSNATPFASMTLEQAYRACQERPGCRVLGDPAEIARMESRLHPWGRLAVVYR